LQPVPPRWLEVWVDHPQLGGCFTYRVPEGSAPEAGDLLSVPFGQQMAGAVALGWRSELPAGVDPQSVREIEAVVAKGILPKEFWPLLQRVADYYLTPLAQVVRTVLPPGLLSRSQRRIRLLRLPAEGEECSPAAQTLLQLLQAKGGERLGAMCNSRCPLPPSPCGNCSDGVGWRAFGRSNRGAG